MLVIVPEIIVGGVLNGIMLFKNNGSKAGWNIFYLKSILDISIQEWVFYTRLSAYIFVIDDKQFNDFRVKFDIV